MNIQETLNATAWLVIMRQTYKDKIPLPNAMAALGAGSRATLYRRIRELNSVGFKLEIEGEYLKVSEIPESAATWAERVNA